jgi:hypothetical protein
MPRRLRKLLLIMPCCLRHSLPQAQPTPPQKRLLKLPYRRRQQRQPR